ncbi:transcription initiation factor tfiid subunit [Anaeramoeba flamelloides]|uniref:Transcription initiation factor tfiid subunit n=1 Tax=Anaeramoeba flamelloides TaxID=1746091 RepID=A0AAV7ZS75_9EUKA|nr:transcription initiation factor tfiid subunit [Anaeramoeba flamelloides]
MNTKWRFQSKFEIINIPIEIITKEDLNSSIKEFNKNKKNNENNNFENFFLKDKFKRSHRFNNKKNRCNKNGKGESERKSKSKWNSNNIKIQNENENENGKQNENENENLQLGNSNCKKFDTPFPTIELKISRRIFYSFISNLQEEISNFVGEITNENEDMLINDTEIVCIGGFSNSNVLKHLIKRQFSFVSKEQRIPNLNFDEYYSDGAVIKGAIVFGLYQNIITNQKFCKNVGFAKLKTILNKTNNNKESNSVINIPNGSIFEESFQMIINKNQSYPIDKIFKFEIEIDTLKFPELICLISTSQYDFKKHLIHDTKCNYQLLFEHQMKMSLNLKESFHNLNKNISQIRLIKLQFEFSFLGAEMIIKLRDLLNSVVLPFSSEYNYAGFWDTISTLHYNSIKKKYQQFLNNDLNNYYHNKIKNQLKSNNKHKNKTEIKDNHKHKNKHKHKKKKKKKREDRYTHQKMCKGKVKEKRKGKGRNKGSSKNQEKCKHKNKGKGQTGGKDKYKEKGEGKGKAKSKSQNNDKGNIREMDIEWGETKERSGKKLQENHDQMEKEIFLDGGENHNVAVGDNNNNKNNLTSLEISKEGGKKELDNK